MIGAPQAIVKCGRADHEPRLLATDSPIYCTTAVGG
jgi:hypothetical protein